MGDPLDGVSVDLTFRFYDAETGMNLLLTALQTSVQVSGGSFSVLLGSGTLTPGTESILSAVFQNHSEVYMSTEVDTDGEMTPRQRIGSVGYAFKAGGLSHIVPRDVAPAQPSEGDIYMDNNTDTLMVYDGNDWQACW